MIDGGGRPNEDGAAVRTRALTKTFGRRTVVAGIDLDVPRGSIFGFLGPNGSGKTTTIRMLLGLAEPTSGDVSVLGHPMPRSASTVLPAVGALVEGPGFYPFLSGAANLVRLDSADPLASPRTRAARIDAALHRVGLGGVAGTKVKAYSLGMKQRLGLANALLRPRELLVLDEPTNGLDPQGTREVRHLIRSLAADGTTVFLSSHLLAEIEQVCTHAAVMTSGRLVAQGPLDELSDGPALLNLLTTDPEGAERVLRRHGVTPQPAEPRPDGHLVRTELGGRTVEEIVEALVRAGVPVRGVMRQRPTLEERFVALTGEGFDVELMYVCVYVQKTNEE